MRLLNDVLTAILAVALLIQMRDGDPVYGALFIVLAFITGISIAWRLR